MILSTKGRYAVMAMVELARREGDRPVALSELAESQEIPLAYLEQIFARLKKAELVTSTRGPGGGYQLSREASEIPMVEIIVASDEQIEMTRCGGVETGCMKHNSKCLTHDLWAGLSEQIQLYLQAVSLADVASGKVKDVKIAAPRVAPGHFYDFVGIVQ